MGYGDGLYIRKNGRAYIMCRDGSQLAYANAILLVYGNQPMRPGQVVHHINGDLTDDRLENLELLSRAEHLERHRPEWELRRRKAVSAAVTKRNLEDNPAWKASVRRKMSKAKRK